MDIEHLKYPIGRFKLPEVITTDQLESAITYIRNYPILIKNACENLDETYLNLAYRPGGWTVKQVIHHVADSHMNAFIRFKLALTEKNPVIKPYLEQEWAVLADMNLDISHSLDIIASVHLKWATILDAMKDDEFERCYFHPESKSLVSLKEACLLYHWHGEHHLGHIQLPSLYK